MVHAETICAALVEIWEGARSIVKGDCIGAVVACSVDCHARQQLHVPAARACSMAVAGGVALAGCGDGSLHFIDIKVGCFLVLAYHCISWRIDHTHVQQAIYDL